MKTWMKYERYLMEGEWHVHTSHTDGENCVDDYCRKALALGIPLIAFTEHVRRTLTYNFQDLLEEVEIARKKYGKLIILTGCEAKVLENGDLDVSIDVAEKCDVVLMAFHSFPNNKAKYINALRRALTDPGVDIWAHPGLQPLQNNFQLTDKEITNVLESASHNDVLIEINRKYRMPPARWVKIGRERGAIFVRGSDIHSVKEMRRKA